MAQHALPLTRSALHPSVCHVATGSLQLALQRQLPAELLVPLSHAKDSASHLMDIVNDLISLSAIESGTLQLGTPRRAAPPAKPQTQTTLPGWLLRPTCDSEPQTTLPGWLLRPTCDHSACRRVEPHTPTR